MKGEIVFPARIHLEDGTTRAETSQDRKRRKELAEQLGCVATFRGTVDGEGRSDVNKAIDLLQNLTSEQRIRIQEVFKDEG